MRTLFPALASVALATALVAAPSDARADGNDYILTLEAGASHAPQDPYDDAYTLGAQGGVGFYYAVAPQLLLGKRFDLLVLAGDSEAGNDDYGYGSLMAAARFRPFADPTSVRRSTGLFIEGALGPAIAEGDLRLAFAGGLGYVFPVGSLGIGPQVRYTQVIERSRFNEEDARILTGGIVFTFLDDPARPEYASRSIDLGDPEPEPQMAKTEPPADFDQTLTVFVGDQMLVDERVFFDFDRAELRPRGRQVLDHIVELYQETGGDWTRLRVQGHADERGPTAYNVDLSRRRAQAVRAYLSSQGIPAAILDIEAYGESRPLIEDATTERDYQLNRRVAFEIVREGEAEDR